MVMFLLSFVKGSKSAEGDKNPLADMDPGGPGLNPLADMDRGGPYPLGQIWSKSARTPVITDHGLVKQQITRHTANLF